MKLTDTLKERGTTHGDFTDNSVISQQFKAIIRQYDSKLSPVQKEALDMVVHKISRILAGDPYFIDAWRDCAGYSQLIVDILSTTPGARDVKQEYIEIK